MFISVSLIMVVPIAYVVRMTLSVADIWVGLIIGTPLNYTYLYLYACIGRAVKLVESPLLVTVYHTTASYPVN